MDPSRRTKTSLQQLRNQIAWHLWLGRGAERRARRLEVRVAAGRSEHPDTARRLANAYRRDAAGDAARVQQLRGELAQLVAGEP